MAALCFAGNPAVLSQDPWLSGSASRRMWHGLRPRWEQEGVNAMAGQGLNRLRITPSMDKPYELEKSLPIRGKKFANAQVNRFLLAAIG